MNQAQSSMMLATLGGQPQVVTFALDALLARGENIRELIVLYLSDEGSQVNQALARLSAEFSNDRYAGHLCRLRPMAIRSGVRRIPDIRDEADAIATWEMLRDLLSTLKSERQQLHICVSGGRRLMSLLMVSVALLHLGYRDKVWHIYTPDAFQAQARDGAVMHAPPEAGVRLIEVPLVPLGIQFPALQSLTRPTPPNVTAAAQIWLDAAERSRCEAVVEQLTPRQLEILRAFAAGLSPQQVADQMGISLHTVNSHKKVILELCRNVWTEREPVRYYHLREWFGPYFGFL